MPKRRMRAVPDRQWAFLMKSGCLFVTLVMLSLTETAQAQLFSPGQSLRSSDTSLQNAGRLTGDFRHLRRNRRRGDFVGKQNDAPQGFVGNTQGRVQGRAQTATATLREEPQIQVNRPRPAPSRTGIYEPRLTIGFDPVRPSDSDVARQTQASVSRAVSLISPATINVSLTDGVATLRGEVGSAKAKELATLVAQLEPGVESVQNELTVRDSPLPTDPR